MKILNTLQELWDFCEFCPICCESCRTITIDVGPDRAFKLISYSKINVDLIMTCRFKSKGEQYNIIYKIDCLTNNFSVDVSEPISFSSLPSLEDNDYVHSAARAYFYYYINADCKKCNGSYASTSDMEINFLKKKIENFSIDRETFHLLRDKDKFHVSLHHDQNSMLISKCIVDAVGQILDDNKIFKCSLINLDLSNYDKVINKIKTLIFFS